MDPSNIIFLLKNGQDPRTIALNFLETQMQNTPMGVNLLNLAKQNRTAEIEQIARNICSQRGIDFDKEFNNFKTILGIKE